VGRKLREILIPFGFYTSGRGFEGFDSPPLISESLIPTEALYTTMEFRYIEKFTCEKCDRTFIAAKGSDRDYCEVHK
jgi:hypothetical protein